MKSKVGKSGIEKSMSDVPRSDVLFLRSDSVFFASEKTDESRKRKIKLTLESSFRIRVFGLVFVVFILEIFELVLHDFLPLLQIVH